MRIFQQLKTIPLYISYYLRVVDKYSLQAPYVFNFYVKLISLFNSRPVESDIEKKRIELQRSEERIVGNDFGAGSLTAGHTKERAIDSIAKWGISSQETCLFLTGLARLLKPQVCLELGTSLGITTAYLARAIEGGKIYTFEGNDKLCEHARDNWKALDCDNIRLIPGNIDETLPDFLESQTQISFAIIDANHTKKALLGYFAMIKEKLSEEGVIFIDDIRWSQEMYDGWRAITRNDRVSLSLEFKNFGLIINKSGINKQHYILSI